MPGVAMAAAVAPAPPAAERTEEEKKARWRAKNKEMQKGKRLKPSKFSINTPRVAPVYAPASAAIVEDTGGPVREHGSRRSDADNTGTTTPLPLGAPASEAPTPETAKSAPAVSNAKKPKRLSLRGWLAGGRKAKGGAIRNFTVFQKNMLKQSRLEEKRRLVAAKRAEAIRRKAQNEQQRKEDKERRKKAYLERIQTMKERRLRQAQKRYEARKLKQSYGKDALVSKRINPTTTVIEKVQDAIKYRSVAFNLQGHWRYEVTEPLLIVYSQKKQKQAKKQQERERRQRYVQNKMRKRLVESVNPPLKTHITKSGRRATVAAMVRNPSGRNIFNERCDR